MQQEQVQVDNIVGFIQQTYYLADKKHGVIAVSGGIDSAVSCALLNRALSPGMVYPVLLPYGNQSIIESELVLNELKIPKRNWRVINIEPIVNACVIARGLNARDKQDLGEVSGDSQGDAKQAVRLGNLMARVRMMIVYDVAREVDGLVCGTENKSERYLGYFTRYGDGASDLEPLCHVYKTQVIKLGRWLHLPPQLITQAPSAGLWPGQTDEAELGFTYVAADSVLAVIIDQHPQLLKRLVSIKRPPNQRKTNLVMSELATAVTHAMVAACLPIPDSHTIHKVLARVRSQWFKQEVPYELAGSFV